MRSTIQRAPEAEDGEIVSSPELDAADLEIKIHAEVTSSEDSDIEETNQIEESLRSPSNDVITLDTPEEKSIKSLVHNEFPQKEQPISKKRIHSVVHNDDDVEIDHLEIAAPQQLEAKRPKKTKDSPNKGKYSSMVKDRRSHRAHSPKEDSSRKRPYDVFDERHSRSDPDDKYRRPSKRDDTIDDLRKHLLKKGELKSNRDYDRRSGRERGRDRERNKESDDRYSRSRSEYERYVESTKESKETNYDTEYKRKLSRDKYKDNSGETDSQKIDKKDKSKYKKIDEKSRKKKKRKYKESDEYHESKDSREKSYKQIELEKSPVKEENLSYDDITSSSSDSSPAPLAKSPESASSESEAELSPENSPSPSPSPSVSRSPSRSPSPVRSPTPVKKRTYFPAIEGCRSVEEFVWLNRIEEGTYGVVYRAKDRNTEEIVALKRLKMEKEREGFPITSLREINTLLKSQHPNIVTVREIVVGNNMDKIYIVMDYVEHDLKSLMESMTQPFLVGEIKTLVLQLLRGMRHLHDNWILHRDIKTSNLLVSHKGILKIGDFGLAREYGSPIKKYTSVVVTLWYRAPELLLRTKYYSTAIDMWSVGCVLAELLTMKPLFPGKAEIDQINRIFKELGTPNDTIWPGPPAYSELPQVKMMNIAQHPYNVLRDRFGATLTDIGFNLLNSLLTYDPARRISADQAIKHEFFMESPLPVDPSMFPTWPAKSELGHKQVKKNASPKPPEGGTQFDAQMGEDGGFHMPSTKSGSSAKGLGFNLRF